MHADLHLADIEARREQRGIRRMLYQITGKAREDHRAAEAAKANLENIRWRIAEKTEPLKARQAEELRQLEQRQQDRSDRLEQRIEVLRWRNATYWRTQPEPEQAPPEREPANDQPQRESEVERLRREYRERFPEPERDFERGR